jgi:serine/threonine-protein kinase
MNKYYFIILSFIILLSGSTTAEETQAQAPPQPVSEQPEVKGDSPPDQKTDSSPELHVSKDAGYSIQFPKEWEVMKGVMGTDVVALAPSKDPEDLFRENVNIIFANLDSPISRKDYYDYNLKSLSQLLTDFDLEENLDVQLDGMEAKKIVFTHTLGVVNAKVMQFLMIDGQKAYVLTFTADPLDFDKYRPKFEEIANSFKFQREKL